MTLFHAHAQYIFIVYANYQKTSVKALVQIDFPVICTSKILIQKQTGKTRAVRGSDYSPPPPYSAIWGERQMKNKGMNKQQQPDSSIHDTSAYWPCVYQVSTFQASQFLRKVWQKFQCLKIGEKEKWRNKGMNMQQQSDSGTHETSAHCPCVYQVSIFYVS